MPVATPYKPARLQPPLVGAVKAIVLPVVLVIAWHIAVKVSGTSLIPTPYAVGVTLWDFCFGGIHGDTYSGTMLTHLGASVARVYAGFFAAAVVGLPLGLAVGRGRLAGELVDPVLRLLRAVPVTAWLPLSLILFGLGPHAAIFLVFLGAFYPIVLNTASGMRSVDVKLSEAAQMLGCSGGPLLRQVVLPAAMPAILEGLRVAQGFAWLLIVVGEMGGLRQGLGAVIMQARMLARADLAIAGMIVIGLAAFVTDRILAAASRRLLRWRAQQHG